MGVLRTTLLGLLTAAAVAAEDEGSLRNSTPLPDQQVAAAGLRPRQLYVNQRVVSVDGAGGLVSDGFHHKSPGLSLDCGKAGAVGRRRQYAQRTPIVSKRILS